METASGLERFLLNLSEWSAALQGRSGEGVKFYVKDRINCLK